LVSIRSPDSLAGGGATVAASVGLTLLTLGLEHASDLPVPLAQWMHILPACSLGLALALLPDTRGGLVVGVCLTLCVGASGLAFGWQPGTLQLTLAAVALLACRALRLPETAASRFSARIAMGVYLVHPLVGSILMRTAGLERETWALAGATAIGAIALAALLEMLGSRIGSQISRRV